MAKKFTIPQYPDALKKTTWDRGLSKFQKFFAGDSKAAKGLDDIPTYMKKAEQAFNAVSWKTFDIWQRVPPGGKKTHADLEVAMKNAQKEIPKVQKCMGALRELEVNAQGLAKKWKGEKLTPKAATALAESVAKEAKMMSYNYGPGALATTLKAQQKEVADQIDKLQEGYAKMKKMCEKYIRNCAKGVTSGVDQKDWFKFWQQDVRGLGTQLPGVLPQHKELMPEYKKWKTWSSQKFSKLDTQEEVNKTLKEMKPVITKVAKALL